MSVMISVLCRLHGKVMVMFYAWKNSSCVSSKGLEDSTCFMKHNPYDSKSLNK